MRVNSVAELPADLRAAAMAALGKIERKPSKYRNVKVVIDGIRFDSKLEGRCYQDLVFRQRSGVVAWFILQPTFWLEGGVKYRADFLAVLASGGVEVIDAKGLLTRSTANKLKQVKARYGVDVQLWPKR